MTDLKPIRNGAGNASFRHRVRYYESIADGIKDIVEKDPVGWEKYQDKVNFIIDSAFRLFEEYEITHLHDQKKVQRMKGFFIKHFRRYFKLGSFNRQVIERPFGYHGDFKIIDDIYLNQAFTSGVERCMDDYFLNTPAAVATRNRKEDFKTLIGECILREGVAHSVQVMDLGSGPCRDISELIQERDFNDIDFHIDCVDNDQRAIDYAKDLLLGSGLVDCIRFFKFDVIRMALTKDVRRYFLGSYDLIVSSGLFDYLADKIAIRLISNLKQLLKPGGRLIISNYTHKFNNPSRFFMEWGGGWDLIYRTEPQFLDIFKQAGFMPTDLKLQFEKQKIMQYCIAQNSC